MQSMHPPIYPGDPKAAATYELASTSSGGFLPYRSEQLQRHSIPMIDFSYRGSDDYTSNAEVYRTPPSPTPSPQDQNALAPISKLPAELLTTIFLLTIPDDPHLSHSLRLGAVCQSWRSVAWSCTELWSHLHLYFEYSEYEPARARRHFDLGLLREWMDRTGKIRPLQLTIRCSVFSIMCHRTNPFIENTALLRFLGEGYRERWKKLDLCIPLPWLRIFTLPSPSPSTSTTSLLNPSKIRGPAPEQDVTIPLIFPALTHATLIPFDSDPRLTTGHTVLTSISAPSLTHVTLQGIYIHPPNPTLLQPAPLTFNALHTIHLLHTRSQSVFNILPFCTAAVEIKITLLWGSYAQGTPPPARWDANLPRLEYLTVFAENPGFLASILRREGFRAPRCGKIKVNLLSEGVENRLENAIAAFVRRCGLRKVLLGVDSAWSKINGEEDVTLFGQMVQDASGAEVDVWFD
ncbi:hypothetical protein DFP72DRAFT_290122 [Ephemerocybe angulata]|uniref:F-box domain-containing protein n=1 Tax=Ephemerocybe angulata TaxID=980116 RepID=A0A8H6H6E1_9AGAR|nr:hypothetical protein DFP72DRAFT_290122 [Tulosesus angulatus]